jgi:hypothetical protein
MRNTIVCGLLALAGIASAAESTGVVPVYADSVSKLMWYQADQKGFPPQKTPGYNGPWAVQKWTSPEQYLVWQVQVEKAGDYEIAVHYQCGAGGGGTTFEVTAPKGKLTGATHETGNAWRKPNWELQRLTGTVKLPAGKSQLEMRILTQAGSAPELMQLRALELVRPAVRKATAERARKTRGDTSWMVEAKYGLMTHWTSQTKPRSGPAKPYCEAAKDFDVERYADMAKETGAGYVAFTTSHMEFYFPAPIQAIDKIVPGRTCQRDLIGDLADALNKRGLKLVVFCGYSIADKPFAEPFGYQDPARLNEFAEKMMPILREIGQRYGTRMAGMFFDGSFETRLYAYQFPFEKYSAAARTGNPKRVLGYNHWSFPKITDFEDYWIGESGNLLLQPPEASVFAPGGVQEGLQAHLNLFLDDSWLHQRLDTEIRAPLHKDQELVDFVKHCVETKTVPLINLGVYQDGTVSEASLNQMRAVRKAIRGQ